MKLVYFLLEVSIVVSIESLLLISIDRLFAVVSPLKAKLKSKIDQHSKHVVCRHCLPRTLFLQFQTDPLPK